MIPILKFELIVCFKSHSYFRNSFCRLNNICKSICASYRWIMTICFIFYVKTIEKQHLNLVLSNWQNSSKTIARTDDFIYVHCGSTSNNLFESSEWNARENFSNGSDDRRHAVRSTVVIIAKVIAQVKSKHGQKWAKYIKSVKT